RWTVGTPTSGTPVAGAALRFYPHFMHLLRTNGDAYAANVKAHFIRHLTPFVR
ncbi:MAG: hypothetical protein QG637_444, partial [Chloroflexota bacterium]|nr:hypothetical protein [Chloroflexota bacterium]